jgi:hypothetical protein
LASSLAALAATGTVAQLACGDDPCESVAGPAVVTSVDLTPDDPGVDLGESLQLVAVPRSACGDPIADAMVAWSSDAPDVVSVSPGGMITGESPGSATITASSEGVSTSVTASVTCRRKFCDDDRRVAPGGMQFRIAGGPGPDSTTAQPGLDVGR